MSRIQAIVSQNGGVGKTRLAQNLGSELGKAGQRVLLIDFDSQSNLTSGWGIDSAETRLTIYDAMLNDVVESCIRNPSKNVSLIPANSWNHSK